MNLNSFQVSWSSDGQQVVSGGLDGTTRIWDIAPETEVERLSNQGGSVSWSPNGQLIASSGFELNLWDVEEAVDMLTIPVEGKVLWSPDGTMLALSGDQLQLLAVSGDNTTIR